MFYSGRMAVVHLLYLLDSSNEVCKGLTKCWSRKNHLVVLSEFWKSEMPLPERQLADMSNCTLCTKIQDWSVFFLHFFLAFLVMDNSKMANGGSKLQTDFNTWIWNWVSLIMLMTLSTLLMFYFSISFQFWLVSRCLFLSSKCFPIRKSPPQPLFQPSSGNFSFVSKENAVFQSRQFFLDMK